MKRRFAWLYVHNVERTLENGKVVNDTELRREKNDTTPVRVLVVG